MAFKPIIGVLQRSLIKDISLSLGFGIASAYLFWYGYHLPSLRKRDAYYESLGHTKT